MNPLDKIAEQQLLLEGELTKKQQAVLDNKRKELRRFKWSSRPQYTPNSYYSETEGVIAVGDVLLGLSPKTVLRDLEGRYLTADKTPPKRDSKYFYTTKVITFFKETPEFKTLLQNKYTTISTLKKSGSLYNLLRQIHQAMLLSDKVKDLENQVFKYKQLYDTLRMEKFKTDVEEEVASVISDSKISRCIKVGKLTNLDLPQSEISRLLNIDIRTVKRDLKMYKELFPL